MRAGALTAGLSGVIAAAALLGAARAQAPQQPEQRPDAPATPGLAVINCKVAEDRSLTDCRLLEESPPGAGFGEAALRMSHLMRLSPDSTADESGRVTLPILFRPPPDREAAPAPRDEPPAGPPPALDLPGVAAA